MDQFHDVASFYLTKSRGLCILLSIAVPAIKQLVEGLKILILVMLSATSRVNENDQLTNFMIDEFFPFVGLLEYE